MKKLLPKLTIGIVKKMTRYLGAQGLIVIAFKTIPGDKFQAVSYGSDRSRCRIMQLLTDHICDKIGKGEIEP